MKVVAVSQRVDVIRGERRDNLDQRLCEWIYDCGCFLPIPTPNILQTNKRNFALWLSQTKVRGIILTGGNNVGEEHDRDRTEHLLLRWAFDHKLPVLGICRGMQTIAVWARDPSITPLKKVDNHVGTRHVLSGTISGTANSFHTNSLAICPDGFEVISRSEDNEIEAIKHTSLPWEGWMWHPEREEPFLERDIDRFRELFSI